MCFFYEGDERKTAVNGKLWHHAISIVLPGCERIRENRRVADSDHQEES
jgi:hypothetical protein